MPIVLHVWLPLPVPGLDYLPPATFGDADPAEGRRIAVPWQGGLRVGWVAGARAGQGYVIDLLRGTTSDRASRSGHDQLSVFGIGKSTSKELWHALARSLIHQGALDETMDGYPTLALTEGSWAVMRGEQRVHAADPVSRERTASRRTTNLAAELGPRAAGLFEHLRKLRKQLADERGVPPYHVFNDASLREMASREPTSPGEFADIPGVGAMKLETWGPIFITAILEYEEA
mgnify:CR=1 FL=1